MNWQIQHSLGKYCTLISMCAAISSLSTSGCGNWNQAYDSPTDVGATPGGQKDIDQARAVIASGGVPTPQMIAVEGLLAQHDLPVPGAPCDATFCARPAAAWAPSLQTNKNELYVHLGMVSNKIIDRASRPPLDIIAVVDKSASMGIDMDETNQAVASILDQLKQGDRFAEVVFDDHVSEHVGFGTVGDPTGTRDRILSIRAGGGGDLMAGLRRGFEIAAAQQQQGRLSRVMLFTCGYPSNYQGPNSFVEVSSNYAARGIGLSLFGILLSYDSIMSQHMGSLRGGNAYYLTDLRKIAEVFVDNFDYIVWPLAYDLNLRISLDSPLSPARVYGIPGDQSGAPRLDLSVKSVFPSRNRGAIVLRLDGMPTAGAALGKVDLDYVDLFDGAKKQAQVALSPAPAMDQPSYEGLGVHKAVVLVNEGVSLLDICEKAAQGQRPAARDAAQQLRDYLAAEVAALNDDGLRKELQMIDQLISNLS